MLIKPFYVSLVEKNALLLTNTGSWLEGWEKNCTLNLFFFYNIFILLGISEDERSDEYCIHDDSPPWVDKYVFLTQFFLFHKIKHNSSRPAIKNAGAFNS
jgi:hypothetical protein